MIGVETSATTRVPGPLGSLAAQTLQSLGSTVDQLLPQPPAAQIRSVTGTLLSGLPAR